MREPKPQTPDEVEMLPDAWERTERAMKIAARHAPVRMPAPKPKPKPFPPKSTETGSL